MALLLTEPSSSVFLGQQSENIRWFPSDSTRNCFNVSQLLFNEDAPSSCANRASRVSLPPPVVIEGLLPVSETSNIGESTRSSFTFKAINEERLQAAVKLVKQDLRHRQRYSQLKSFSEDQDNPLSESNQAEDHQAKLKTQTQTKLKVPNAKKNVSHPVYKKHTAKRKPDSSLPRAGMSPPTRDPGPRLVEEGKDASLRSEIHKLQSELELYIQKVKELALRGGKSDEPLEPKEQRKLEIRQEKQAARSAGIVYVLQQQAKEIQGETEKHQSQTIWDSKKVTAINKLSAAYRALRRALQGVIHQLIEPPQYKVPHHYKEISQLIRQLSLCSAKVEVDQESALPRMTINILEKLEILDSALSKQEMLEKAQAQACLSNRKSPVLPRGTPKGARNASALGPGKGNHGKRLAVQKQARNRRIAFSQPLSRTEVLRNSLIRIAQQRELKDPIIEKPTVGRVKINQKRDTGFQQPTVSSRLRVNRPHQKEPTVPWIPTSPHSLHPNRSPERRSDEPQCLFSPVKDSPSPPKQRLLSGLETQLVWNLEKKEETHNDALRKAWLDELTIQSLEGIDQRNKEEAELIQRFEAVPPTRWAERAEQDARVRIRPLLDEAQNPFQHTNRIDSSSNDRLRNIAPEQLSKVLEEDLLEDASGAVWAVEMDRQLEGMAQRRLQAPTLESMLLRMEEMQRDQEEVRRRFASITYSDPLYRDRPGVADSQLCAAGHQPGPPQPVILSKPVLAPPSGAAIILEKPIETEHSLLSEEAAGEQQQHTNNVTSETVQGNTVISVSNSALGNIHRYREDYNTYLRAAEDNDVCGVNPWALVESVADELLSDTLAEVAAEFLDVAEECAEALFTSEFLQPD